MFGGIIRDELDKHVRYQQGDLFSFCLKFLDHEGNSLCTK